MRVRKLESDSCVVCSGNWGSAHGIWGYSVVRHKCSNRNQSEVIFIVLTYWNGYTNSSMHYMRGEMFYLHQPHPVWRSSVQILLWDLPDLALVGRDLPHADADDAGLHSNIHSQRVSRVFYVPLNTTVTSENCSLTNRICNKLAPYGTDGRFFRTDAFANFKVMWHKN